MLAPWALNKNAMVSSPTSLVVGDHHHIETTDDLVPFLLLVPVSSSSQLDIKPFVISVGKLSHLPESSHQLTSIDLVIPIRFGLDHLLLSSRSSSRSGQSRPHYHIKRSAAHPSSPLGWIPGIIGKGSGLPSEWPVRASPGDQPTEARTPLVTSWHCFI
jgi:hypothetical protein